LAAVAAAIAFVSSPAAFAAVQGGPWDGPCAGGQLQLNTVSADGLSSETVLGLAVFGGYRMQFPQHFVLGDDVFYRYNQAKDHNVPGFVTSNLGTETSRSVFSAFSRCADSLEDAARARSPCRKARGFFMQGISMGQ